MFIHKWINLLSFFLFPLFSFSQYNNNWCIGDSVRLSFSTSPPSAFFTNQSSHKEPGTTVSDDSGNLLFYVDHEAVYNRKNDIMLNGDSIMGSATITQGILAIPRPHHSNQYYLFNYGYCENRTYCFNYSIIDMELDNGFGGITLKRKIIINPHAYGKYTEKLQAIKHGNGEDWWVIMHEQDSDRFLRFFIDSTLIQGPSWQSIGNRHGTGSNYGQLIASQDGKKLAAVSGNGMIDVFDFDRCSGKLSNHLYLGDGTSSFYGCSFSPSGRFFYVSNWAYDSTRIIIQFDLWSPSPKFSQKEIWNSTNLIDWTGQHLLGPDGKIYISHMLFSSLPIHIPSIIRQKLTVIQNPDSLGIVCDIRPHSFDVSPFRTFVHLPNLPNFNLGPLLPPPANAGPNRTTTCVADSALLGTPAQAGYLYAWQPAAGLSDPNIAQPKASPGQTTTYILTVIDTSRSCENVSTDTVIVTYEPAISSFSLDAGPDRSGCPGEGLRIGLEENPNWHYQWQPETGLDDPQKARPRARLQSSQRYILRVTDRTELCEKIAYDTVDVQIENPQYAEAGPDMLLCEGIEMADTIGVRPIPGAVYSWFPAFGLDDPEAAQPMVRLQQPQLYRLQVTVDTFCVSWDSVFVQVEPCTKIFAPSAISPNGDGINDVFIITNLPPGSSFQVWNRWGNRVYQSDSYGNDWQPNQLPEGVYVWRLRTQAGEDLRGTVTVIR